MREILPDHPRDDDDVKRAFRWVSQALRRDPRRDPDPLIGEAVDRFGLTLKEAELLGIAFADVSKRPKPNYPWTDFGL